LPASAACTGALITHDQSAKVTTGMDSIDIELCRRLAGLAVSFLIELISRFRSHQCSIRLTLVVFRQFLGKQPQRIPFLVARRITFACLAY
jgi:hypothetical protein